MDDDDELDERPYEHDITSAWAHEAIENIGLSVRVDGVSILGEVIAVHEDGSRHVRFEDGGEELTPPASAHEVTVLLAHSWRTLKRAASRNFEAEREPPPPLAAGMRVMAPWLGGEALYLGVVAAVHDDGTLHLRYDDGDEDERASPEGVQAAVVIDADVFRLLKTAAEYAL